MAKRSDLAPSRLWSPRRIRSTCEMSPQAVDAGASRVDKELVDRRGNVLRALEVDGPTDNSQSIVRREHLDGSDVGAQWNWKLASSVGQASALFVECDHFVDNRSKPPSSSMNRLAPMPSPSTRHEEMAGNQTSSSPKRRKTDQALSAVAGNLRAILVLVCILSKTYRMRPDLGSRA